MATTLTKNTRKSARSDSSVKDITASYNAFKDYKGQFYTGMKVGRSHKWNYDKGIWKETKITPERWELVYDVIKRRAGHAPKGSGVPVGTAYHWFILSHQYVEKLNADDYTTSMIGLKFKLAHKRAINNKWSASDATQRKHLIGILKSFIEELESEPEKTVPIQLDFEYKSKRYTGVAVPVMSSCSEGSCMQLDLRLNNKHLGVIRSTKDGWRMTGMKQGIVTAIGEQINQWYQ